MQMWWLSPENIYGQRLIRADAKLFTLRRRMIIPKFQHNTHQRIDAVEHGFSLHI